MRNIFNRHQGFTIFEVLIVLFIGGGLMLVVSSILVNFSKGNKTSSVQSDYRLLSELIRAEFKSFDSCQKMTITQAGTNAVMNPNMASNLGQDVKLQLRDGTQVGENQALANFQLAQTNVKFSHAKQIGSKGNQDFYQVLVHLQAQGQAQGQAMNSVIRSAILTVDQATQKIISCTGDPLPVASVCGTTVNSYCTASASNIQCPVDQVLIGVNSAGPLCVPAMGSCPVGQFASSISNGVVQCVTPRAPAGNGPPVLGNWRENMALSSALRAAAGADLAQKLANTSISNLLPPSAAISRSQACVVGQHYAFSISGYLTGCIGIAGACAGFNGNGGSAEVDYFVLECMP